MEALGSVFEWIGANEAVLSGIAAAIVILGVLYSFFRRLFASSKNASPEPAATPSALAPAACLYPARPSLAVGGRRPVPGRAYTVE